MNDFGGYARFNLPYLHFIFVRPLGSLHSKFTMIFVVEKLDCLGYCVVLSQFV